MRRDKDDNGLMKNPATSAAFEKSRHGLCAYKRVVRGRGQVWEGKRSCREKKKLRELGKEREKGKGER